MKTNRKWKKATRSPNRLKKASWCPKRREKMERVKRSAAGLHQSKRILVSNCSWKRFKKSPRLQRPLKLLSQKIIELWQ